MKPLILHSCKRTFFNISWNLHKVNVLSRGHLRNGCTRQRSQGIYCGLYRCLCSKPPDGGQNNEQQKPSKDTSIKEPRTLLRDYSQPFNANTLITRERALSEYLLDARHLEGLEKEEELEAYSDSNDIITTYKKSDIEKVAIKVHGSLQAMEKKRAELDRHYSLGFGPRNLRKSIYGDHTIYGDNSPNPPFIFIPPQTYQKETSLNPVKLPWYSRIPGVRDWLPGEKVALCAIAVNFTCLVIKSTLYVYTGSSSVFSEVTHSFADLTNQLLVYYGLVKSYQMADPSHPYGLHNWRYVGSLISGVALFAGGGVASIYHSYGAFMNPTPVTDPVTAMATMVLMTAVESGTLYLASKDLRKTAKEKGISFWDCVKRNENPTSNVVFIEDSVAVFSAAIASGFLGLAHLGCLHHADALGGLINGSIMAAMSIFLVKTNADQLIGSSIEAKTQRDITRELENDPVVRYVRDVKTTKLGSLFRFKAEIENDGREITQIYLNKYDLDELFKKHQETVKTPEDLQAFLLEHGEGIIDQAGKEINRIEKKLKKSHPSLRYIDLEQN